MTATTINITQAELDTSESLFLKDGKLSEFELVKRYFALQSMPYLGICNVYVIRNINDNSFFELDDDEFSSEFNRNN